MTTEGVLSGLSCYGNGIGHPSRPTKELRSQPVTADELGRDEEPEGELLGAVYLRARYVEEIFFATSTSRSVTFPPRSYRVSSKHTSPYAMCTSG